MTLIESADEVAEISSVFRDGKRVKAFHWLKTGVKPKEISENLDITRPSLQYYIQDFKDSGLLRSEGNDYILTEKGENVHSHLVELASVDEAD